MLNFFYTLIFIALWTPVSQQLGDHDLATATTRSYGIPTTVPDTAREALFSADADCNTNGGNINHYIEYYVQINGTNYTKLLYTFDHQQHWMESIPTLITFGYPCLQTARSTFILAWPSQDVGLVLG